MVRCCNARCPVTLLFTEAGPGTSRHPAAVGTDRQRGIAVAIDTRSARPARRGSTRKSPTVISRREPTVTNKIRARRFVERRVGAGQLPIAVMQSLPYDRAIMARICWRPDDMGRFIGHFAIGSRQVGAIHDKALIGFALIGVQQMAISSQRTAGQTELDQGISAAIRDEPDRHHCVPASPRRGQSGSAARCECSGQSRDNGVGIVGTWGHLLSARTVTEQTRTPYENQSRFHGLSATLFKTTALNVAAIGPRPRRMACAANCGPTAHDIESKVADETQPSP